MQIESTRPTLMTMDHTWYGELGCTSRPRLHHRKRQTFFACFVSGTKYLNILDCLEAMPWLLRGNPSFYLVGRERDLRSIRATRLRRREISIMEEMEMEMGLPGWYGTR